jgi:lipopolysaccharide/colanic/teichoic acid biosynthesis glycosyltransferase
MDGVPFTMRKFRTMLPVDEARGFTDDSSRMTSFGRTLRSTSLDELPTLWNVIRGDMSLVGPRPLLMKYLPLYSPEQARRHEVRPGLTGLAQISGRNAISWEDKFRLDVQYIERRSLRMDLQILRDTVRAVVRREGITETGSATMTEFRGEGAAS